MIKHTEKELLADTKQALFKKPENFPKDNKDSLELIFRFFPAMQKIWSRKAITKSCMRCLAGKMRCILM